jgi:hypothetical protein
MQADRQANRQRNKTDRQTDKRATDRQPDRHPDRQTDDRETADRQHDRTGAHSKTRSGMGYGSRALELLLDYYSGKLADPTGEFRVALCCAIFHPCCCCNDAGLGSVRARSE